MHVNMPEEKLRELTGKLLGDASYGNIIRIKGFMADEKGGWLELNATKEQFSLAPVEKGQEVLIVIGEQLNEAVINACFDPYITERM